MKNRLVAAGACLALLAGVAHFQATASSSFVDVSTVPQLQAAVANLTSGQVIRVAAGRYALTQQLRIRNGVTNVALVGATGNRNDVVIVGTGMNTPGVDIGIKVENAQDVRIADLSVGEAYEHPIQLQGEQGAERVRVSNVRLFDAGQQFLKSTVDYAGVLNGVDDVIVENSLFEFTIIGPANGYTQGIDAHHAANWIIRNNVFRNIRVPPGAVHLNRPGVLMWGGSRNTTVAGNMFINCERGIIFGQGGQEFLGNSHSGGLIVNNFIYRTEPQHADAGISIWDSPGTRVYHNTVIQNGTYPAAIEYRFPSTTGVEIVNNLTDGLILQRDNASALVTNNYTAATPSLFVNAAAGDLHLRPTAAVAIDQGRSIGVAVDRDADARPSGAAPDLGADEWVGGTTSAPASAETLLTTQVPDGEFRDGNGITYELGLILRSDVAGHITALRYWKASLEDGPHIGRVWTAAGQLLATVTFTNETAVGWQQQALATPLAIAAQTDYIVTVSTGANGYFVAAVKPGATFAGIVTNGHLSTSGVNAGRYGPLGSAAPNASAGHYFRDIVFVPDTGPADTTPPTVAITAPGSGSTVGGTVTLSATANDNVAVVGVQFQVDGANVGSEIATAPYSVSWNSGAVTNGPHTVTAIARDGAGNTAPASIGVTVSNAGPPPGQQTLLTTQVPDGEFRDGNGITYELGLILRSDVAGHITALRYWKAPLEDGPHIGRVWTAAGQLLATVTFTNETAVGWQQQALATPLAIAAETDYIVTVSTGANGYFVAAVQPGATFAGIVTNGHLSTSGANAGRYGPLGSAAPNASAGHYFRDVVFVPDDGTAIQTQLTLIVSGLSSPLFVGHAGDNSGRLFIVERGGMIKVLQPGATTPTVFLNITSRVQSTGSEQGLLGLAFHPLYEANGRFFVFYTRSGGEIVVAEYHVSGDPNFANPAEEEILLTIPHAAAANHNGGMLAFGPDNLLYIGVGDGGGSNNVPNNAQNLNVLLGKILRIDIDVAAGQTYVSPPSNPFVGVANARDEIFAYGLRNPWRFSFDRAFNSLWVADVGQGAREEVNNPIVGGGNYGWRIWEGFACTNNDAALCGSPTGYIFPVFDYGHSGGRCSITGGYVYRGSQGAVANGTYVYGDFCTGEIFGWTSGPSQPVLLDTTLNISSFGEDESGELYVVGLGGTVSKIVSAAPPPPPPDATGRSVVPALARIGAVVEVRVK